MYLHYNLLTMDSILQVYKSDPFPGLSLGSQYAVTVMALPVPERWDKFYHSEIFSTQCKTPVGWTRVKFKQSVFQGRGFVLVSLSHIIITNHILSSRISATLSTLHFSAKH